jgi:NAD(P)-dependent dehydrogenase (short-subunit alcohol dehydrogenase family)
MTNLFDISGKVAIVTGGANGLGRMITEGLVTAGARVYFTSRKEADCRATEAELAGSGDFRGIAADLSTPEGVVAFARTYLESEDKLDILINNAGRTWGAPIESFPDKAWTQVMAVNVQAPFTLVRELLPALRKAASAENPARVINIGSIAGAAAEKLSAYSYASSKAAIHHLSKVLAADLAADNITVNALVPGYFPTSMTSHIRAEDEKLSGLLERVPLGRMGTAADMVGTCIFLSSRAGAYVTGVNLSVDGGMLGCR